MFCKIDIRVRSCQACFRAEILFIIFYYKICFGDLTAKRGSNKGIKMRSHSTRISKSSSSSKSKSGQGKQPNVVSKVYSSRISASSSIRIKITYNRFLSYKTTFVLHMSYIFLNILSLGLKDVVLLARLIISALLVPLRVGALCSSPGGSLFDIFVLASIKFDPESADNPELFSKIFQASRFTYRSFNVMISQRLYIYL